MPAIFPALLAGTIARIAYAPFGKRPLSGFCSLACKQAAYRARASAKIAASTNTKARKFYFNGLPGLIDETGFVRWGGMSFQVEAAQGKLKQAIDEAACRQGAV